METSTKDLKRVLGLKELIGVAVGQIIGAGIMSLMGVAIGLTGRSVPISFLLSALVVLVSSVPIILVCGTVRLRGGNYTMTALLSGQKMAGFLMFVTIISNISLSLYALSFADYALAFLPVLSRKLLAFGVLTVFYVVNLLGIDKMAKVQIGIVAVMILALLAFVGFGLGKVSPDYLTQDFMTGGVFGVVKAMAMVTFAVNGAYIVAGLSGECKRPTKDIPISIISSTVGVAILYALIGIVASGVLPVAEVAGKPLNVVAKEIMPTGVYIFFMVGGAMFALISTINAQLASSPKTVLQGCVDGWLPKRVGWLHPRFKTPVIILTAFYAIGLIPIFFGLDIENIASMVSLLMQVCFVLVDICIIRLPKVLPDAWTGSRYHVSNAVLWVVVILSTGLGLFNVVALLTTMSLPVCIGTLAMLAAGFAAVLVRERSGKVHMEISYEVER